LFEKKQSIEALFAHPLPGTGEAPGKFFLGKM
jgi:hypothetical protein